jgi:phosphate transport system permease protein
MKAVFLLSSIFSVLALLVIAVFLMARGIPAISKIGLGEFFGTRWSIGDRVFGILPMLVGSVYVTALATVFGVTLGLFTAIFLYKFCPKRIAGAVRQMVNLLAGIPSVVFGLFGMMTVVPAFRSLARSAHLGTDGYGILSASVILAIMIMPTIVSLSLDALHAVPKENFEGALALGASKERAVFSVMVPSAKSGIFAAVVLSLGRALGETMAVLMVIGNSPAMPTGLFQSVRTLTSNIAQGAMELSGDAFEALIATGVVLFVFTLLINVGFNLLKNYDKDKKRKKKAQKAEAANEVKETAEAGETVDENV